MVTYRAAMFSPEDLPAVVRIHAESDDGEVSLSDLTRDVSRVFVVRDPGEGALAYLDAWFVADTAEVIHVATARAHRRRGLARLLMTALIERALEAKLERVLLEVRSGNAPARALYRALGFEEDGVRARYYSDGEDAVLMSRAV